MEQLISKVEQWSIARKMNETHPSKQYLKVAEETGEIARALVRNNMEELKDSIGDVVVTLIILAQQSGLTLKECLECAYEEIKDRTGKNINGIYIKSEDLSKIDMRNLTKLNDDQLSKVEQRAQMQLEYVFSEWQRRRSRHD